MRRTRFISLLFLMLSLAFFFEPDFRAALLAPLVGIVGAGQSTQGKIPDDQLSELAGRAQDHGDARGMAFVALHLPPNEDATIRRLARLAVSRDPSLTWIYLQLAYRYSHQWQAGDVADEMRDWDARIAAWDPGNAAADLLQADLIRYGHAAAVPIYQRNTPGLLAGLADQRDWTGAMERAFSKPRYDFYSVPRFELERRVLREQHWDYPATIIFYAQEWPTPDLVNITQYSALLRDTGARAEASGRTDEAAGKYWMLAHFGERLRLGGHSHLEQITGDAVRSSGYEHLIPILHKRNTGAESETLAYELVRLRAEDDLATGKSPFAGTYNYSWSVLVMNICAPLVVIFLVLTAACVLYVNVTGRTGTGKGGWFWQLMTVGENYMPLLLFAPCVALYITYFPYARNFSHYMTSAGHIDNFDPVLYNTLPSYTLRTAASQLPMETSFERYATAALIATLVSVALALASQRWERRAEVRHEPQS